LSFCFTSLYIVYLKCSLNTAATLYAIMVDATYKFSLPPYITLQISGATRGYHLVLLNLGTSNIVTRYTGRFTGDEGRRSVTDLARAKFELID
jgi:hypothetical protein